MEYTREIVLQFIPSGDIPVIRVKQGDASARYIRATILRDHEKYIPGAEQTILFREEKPDGHAVLLDNIYPDSELGRCHVVVNADGTVTVELTAQTTTCPGKCRCDLCFVQSDRTISTAPFILEVEKAPDVADIAVSSDDFLTLVEAIKDVGKTNVKSLNDMTDTALDGVADGQILRYDAEDHKWVNTGIESFGFQTEDNVTAIVEQYGYQTADNVNRLIQEYIQRLDGNSIRY